MPEGYVLVDSDVFIWLTRGKVQARRYARHVEDRGTVLSFTTVAELWLGAKVQASGERSRRQLEADIGATIVVPPTREITLRWAQVVAEARGMSPGHPLGQKAQYHDAWVAATALHHGLPLLTANSRHFEGLPGISLVETGS